MKIISVSYWDKKRNWGFRNFRPNDDLTMLVGASGVGKTKVLDAIETIKNIALGRSDKDFSGLIWDIAFVIDNNTYNWNGEFAIVPQSEFNVDANVNRVIRETIKKSGSTIIKREDDYIDYNGVRIKLDQSKSIVNLINEDSFRLIRAGFDSIREKRDEVDFFYTCLRVSDCHDPIFKGAINQIIIKACQNIPTLIFIAGSIEGTESYKNIKEKFTNIFPTVEDIRVVFSDENDEEYRKDSTILQIKERGVDNWISHKDISAGMVKTLYYLCQTEFAAEGTVILIDEIENSLGVNCIRDIADEITASNRNIQFIITSHHPYIINNVDAEYWQILTRKGGEVEFNTAQDLEIGGSRLTLFTQLSNSSAFITGQREVRE